MLYKVLRFIGAIIVAVLFSYLVDVFHFSYFAGASHFFANITWSNWLGFDSLRGIVLPLMWIILWLIGLGLGWLVRGSKIIAAFPILIFILCLITDFIGLFIIPLKQITDEIGQGFFYYLGATLTYLGILACYFACSMGILTFQDS